MSRWSRLSPATKKREMERIARWQRENRPRTREYVQNWRNAHPGVQARYARDAYRRDPEKYRQLAREEKRRLRYRALELCGGARCVDCGCTFEPILEINHKNGGGSREARTTGLSGHPLYLAIVSGRRKTDDLDVRCRPSNALDYVLRKHPELRGKLRVTWSP